MSDVLQVITSTDRRGAEIFALDLEAELRSRGRSIDTVALARTGGHPSLDVPTLGRKSRSADTLVALRRAAIRARVLIAHGSDTVAATAAATLFTGRPFIYRNIGDPAYWLSTPGRRRRMRWMLRQAASIVALWPASAAAMRELGAPSERIRVVPNGVPAARYPVVRLGERVGARTAFGIPANAKVAVSIGSLSPEKDISAAVRAVAKIHDVHLLIVGDGPERRSLERLADELAGKRVLFTGSLPEPRQALAAADVLVLPSRTEGIPAVAIEAALSGLPIVATDVGGVSEVVIDGENGRLVPAGDDGALVAAMRKTLEDPTAFGTAGRTRCLNRFEIAIVADAWEEVLTQLGAWTTQPTSAGEPR